jgi:TRAP-type C4-dicarboxylate transport system substrate-binding protein
MNWPALLAKLTARNLCGLGKYASISGAFSRHAAKNIGKKVRRKPLDQGEKTMKRFVLSAALLALLAAAPPASAQDLPKTQLKGIGLNSPTPVSIYDELPFWRKTVTEASKGAVTMDITPLDQMGVDDKTMLRLLKLGVADFAAMDISKMAGDDPRFEGCDLAGLTLDPKKAREGCNAYREVIDKRMQENWGAKLIAFGGNAPQVFWCRDKIDGLAGLKGKKIRVFNRTMNDFIEGVGGTTISMAFAEVVPALQRGTVDCGVTGSASGNTASWFEVANFLYPLSLGWSINVHAFNLNSWKKLDPKVQDFLLAEMKKYEDKMWQTIEEVTADAENCNFNKEPCKFGKKASMTLVPVGEADRAEHKKLMETRVLAGWAKRCGGPCAKEWNETVGKAVGLAAPTS